MKTEKKNSKKEQKESAPLATPTSQNKVNTRGRIFEGIVTKKFPTRVAIEIERILYIKKYERFYKKKTRIHARLPDSMANEINVGDYIKVQECRPLSKIIHFIVLGKASKTKEAKK